MFWKSVILSQSWRIGFKEFCKYYDKKFQTNWKFKILFCHLHIPNVMTSEKMKILLSIFEHYTFIYAYMVSDILTFNSVNKYFYLSFKLSWRPIHVIKQVFFKYNLLSQLYIWLSDCFGHLLWLSFFLWVYCCKNNFTYKCLV